MKQFVLAVLLGLTITAVHTQQPGVRPGPQRVS
jgi:hypothetical protein